MSNGYRAGVWEAGVALYRFASWTLRPSDPTKVGLDGGKRERRSVTESALGRVWG